MEETRFGKCPWCGKKDRVLYFAMGQYDGKIWCDWICMACLDAARKGFVDNGEVCGTATERESTGTG